MNCFHVFLQLLLVIQRKFVTSENVQKLAQECYAVLETFTYKINVFHPWFAFSLITVVF